MWSKTVYTSKVVIDDDDDHDEDHDEDHDDDDKCKRGRKAFDVNIRAAVAFREIGKGHAGIETFCCAMNMPPPMSQDSYDNIVAKMHIAYVTAARDSMKLASTLACIDDGSDSNDNTLVDEIKNVTVSVDGTWQKRGYSSLNGVVTVISNGKCIDTETLSKKCSSCSFWEKKKDSPEYDEWIATHNCSINHRGSSGAMESAGALAIFKRSVRTNKLRYTKYRGDGDSKSYKDIVEADPYPGFKIVKSECVGHVQKRVGSRLRALKVSYKGKLLSDGKRLTGKGRMTDKVINTLQNYYGMAVRQNKGDLYGMKKSIAALIHHCSENDDAEDRHKFCPQSNDTWCKYQLDKVNNTSKYKKSINIPNAISELIKPIFSWKDLGSDKLLGRCLDGETQNVNESLNNVIWTRAPKSVYVGKNIIEIAVASAVLSFNDGAFGIIEVFKNLKLGTKYIVQNVSLRKKDNIRVNQMDRKSTDNVKKKKKKIKSNPERL